MLRYFLIKLIKIINLLIHGKINDLFIHYFRYIIVPIKKKLENIQYKEFNAEDNINIKIVKKSDKNLFKTSFSRMILKQKTIFYLKHGYSGILLYKKNIVIGYMWFTDYKKKHKDLDLLKFTLDPNSVYIFDLFVDKSYRGNNLSTLFMNNALYLIKKEGFENVFGYYEEKNIPSLWLHRTLCFKEFPKLIWKRDIRLIRRSELYTE